MPKYRAIIDGCTTFHEGTLPTVLRGVNKYFDGVNTKASMVHLWEKRGKTVRSWRIVAEWSQCGNQIVDLW